MKKKDIIADFGNNRVQWMLENNCTSEEEVVPRMMELYKEESIRLFKKSLIKRMQERAETVVAPSCQVFLLEMEQMINDMIIADTDELDKFRERLRESKNIHHHFCLMYDCTEKAEPGSLYCKPCKDK